MALILEVLIPEAQLKLLCAKRSSNKTYKLAPEDIQPIIDAVKKASDSQIRIHEVRPKNAECLEDLAVYNHLHSEASYKPEDIVRMIDLSNYDTSFVGTRGAYAGVELHQFEGIRVPSFTRRTDERVYVKLTTPDNAGNITVESLHRKNDLGRRWKAKYEGTPDYHYPD